MKHKYYVVVEYTEYVGRLFRMPTTVKGGMVVDLVTPLTTARGVDDCMKFLRDKYQDAIVLWWEKLEGE